MRLLQEVSSSGVVQGSVIMSLQTRQVLLNPYFLLTTDDFPARLLLRLSAAGSSWGLDNYRDCVVVECVFVLITSFLSQISIWTGPLSDGEAS